MSNFPAYEAVLLQQILIPKLWLCPHAPRLAQPIAKWSSRLHVGNAVQLKLSKAVVSSVTHISHQTHKSISWDSTGPTTSR